MEIRFCAEYRIFTTRDQKQKSPHQVDEDKTNLSKNKL